MKKPLMMVSVLTIVVVLVGMTITQAGMMGAGMGGSETHMGQSPKAGGDKPGEQPSQIPMNPEFAARMMNACIGAMEGMAQMGSMMGGQESTSQTPSEQKR